MTDAEMWTQYAVDSHRLQMLKDAHEPTDMDAEIELLEKKLADLTRTRDEMLIQHFREQSLKHWLPIMMQYFEQRYKEHIEQILFDSPESIKSDVGMVYAQTWAALFGSPRYLMSADEYRANYTEKEKLK